MEKEQKEEEWSRGNDRDRMQRGVNCDFHLPVPACGSTEAGE